MTGFNDTPTDVAPRRTGRRNCPACGGTATGFRSRAWLSGRRCCEQCTGDHDQEAT